AVFAESKIKRCTTLTFKLEGTIVEFARIEVLDKDGLGRSTRVSQTISLRGKSQGTDQARNRPTFDELCSRHLQQLDIARDRLRIRSNGWFLAHNADRQLRPVR